MLGQKKKIISREEKRNIKKLENQFLQKNILKKYFTINNLTTKRPGTGLNAVYWDKVIGKRQLNNLKRMKRLKLSKKEKIAIITSSRSDFYLLKI